MVQTSPRSGLGTLHQPPTPPLEVLDEPSDGAARERAETLAQQMVELNAHISAAEARFLEMLAEFDRDELWVYYGCHCAAQWLSWQCGLGDVAARERVRVARALEKLPKISAAFRCGEISYSKVREMTRIAIPEMEESLLNIARHGTAAHMQRLVRKYRRVERAEAAAEALEQYRRRYVHYRHEDDGMLVIEARLPVEIGELVMKAIDAAVEVLYQDGAGRKRDDEARDPGVDDDANECAASATDVPAGTGAGRDACCGDIADFGVRDALEIEAKVSAETGTGVHGGHASTETLHFDESPSDDEGYISPLWDPHEMPGGNAVIEEFEDESWPDSLGARRADALRLLAETFFAASHQRVDTSAERYQVVVHIDQTLLASAIASSELGRDSPNPICPSDVLRRACELDEGHALAIETARRLACDAALVGLIEDKSGEPLALGRKTRAVSASLRRALRARDGGCRFPGCGRTRFVHFHHIVHWANGGETKLSNLLTLCSFHHHLVHEGGFSVERMEDGDLAFFAPDGSRLPDTGRLDRETIDELVAAAARRRVTLHDLNREHGIEIDEKTGQCLWTGERMDYSIAVGDLLWTRDRVREGSGDSAMH